MPSRQLCAPRTRQMLQLHPALCRSFHFNLLSSWAHQSDFPLCHHSPGEVASSPCSQLWPKKSIVAPYLSEWFPAGLGFAGLVVLEEAAMQWALLAPSSPLGSGVLELRGMERTPSSSPGCSPSLLVRSSQGLLQHQPGRVTNGT